MRLIYRWFTATAPRSWVSHGLACLVFSVVVASIVHRFVPSLTLWVYPLASTLCALFYTVKEMADELRYRQGKRWAKPRWNGVTPMQDQVGDLVGPWCVCASAWAYWILCRL